MAFKTLNTRDLVEGPTKTLLYAHHGWGKTYQCRYYERRYGKGLIISGESGLKSIEDTTIDYLPFSSWDGQHDPDSGVYSFRGIVKMLHSAEFKSAGYEWICIDSLTEVSDRLISHLEHEYRDDMNNFAFWGDYGRAMLGALKWVRDLPIHVYVTCLAKEEKDHNGKTEYWPLLKGQAVAKQVPAIFDHVFCGVRIAEPDASGVPRVRRYVVTDEVDGWHGKARDPRKRLKSREHVDDVTELLERMSMSDSDFADLKKTPQEKDLKDE